MASDTPAFVGTRSVRKSGDSHTVSLPKKELREQLDTDPEEIEGENVVVVLDDDGKMTVDLSPHVGAD